MKSNWIINFIPLIMCMTLTSNALATIELTSRSEEMMSNSICDQAGPIMLSFDEDDYAIISDHLINNDYARIHVRLTAMDIDPSAAPPVLCKSISGGATVPWLPDIGPGVGYVALDDFSYADLYSGEVSHYSGSPDIEAYVYGAVGARYFDIYITAMEDPSAFVEESCWLRVGLYEDLLDIGVNEEETTPICANVEDFSGLSHLTCSYYSIPNTLTINTSDNEIGHFLEQDFTLRNLDENVDCSSIVDDDLIAINLPDPPEGECEVTVNGNYTKYIVLEGPFPIGSMSIVVRTNGATDGCETQGGVYLDSVSLYNVAGSECPGSSMSADTCYLDSGGETAEDYSELCTWYNTQKIMISSIDASMISSCGDKLIIQVDYFVLEEQIKAGDAVMFWLEAMTEPCGNLSNGIFEGARTEGYGSAMPWIPLLLLDEFSSGVTED